MRTKPQQLIGEIKIILRSACNRLLHIGGHRVRINKRIKNQPLDPHLFDDIDKQRCNNLLFFKPSKKLTGGASWFCEFGATCSQMCPIKVPHLLSTA
jgi:hypothetical protein